MGDYPQEITAEEAELQFERISLDWLESDITPTSTIVVARILAPSDVLIKTRDLKGRVRYSLRRWGYAKGLNNPDRCKWTPLEIGPGIDPQQSIIDYNFAVHEETFPSQVVAVAFTYRRAE